MLDALLLPHSPVPWTCRQGCPCPKHCPLPAPAPVPVCTCRSLALLPLFNATSGYLRDKISSTVLTSVAVGVPMVVPPAFLDVYTEFKREHVIVLVSELTGEPGEGGVSAGVQGMQGPQADTVSVCKVAQCQ